MFSRVFSPNIPEPDTNMSAPASITSFALSSFIPPSTSIKAFAFFFFYEVF